ncbi:MAG: TRAP transporter large permease subunit [Nitrospinaceae bacterium]|jgi:tripartite ATP-independent transporter DctM subunit|nr:TRAP transporter large permease subunit [Nitrospinaceae bacterium]MBT3434694.1 TRAP transporter large permease subunit [Nitrospinaceae bacterium]MBT3822984.1 TRAP transporter large permease subunit [Nitrospinaceae bacterium]MBT4095186.1 TRAP transporter large permease subunit [Nitrospinaceae bacterium]MBT4430104.1 TRAP transporter large permease subunit [Nitrospinaceae bacterium]
MEDQIAFYLPLLMFGTLLPLLMLGFPVAFTLGAVGLLFGLIGAGMELLSWSDFNFLPLRIWGIATNFTLLAVPLFVFMGVMLERSGLAEDLLETTGLVFGKIRGGLAMSVVVVGMLLAASTGIVGATVVTMGILALPTMLRRGYSPEVATGTIAASGTLGQIIPPSIILVLLGDIMDVPIGSMFVGAVIPGLVLVAFYLLWIGGVAWLRPDLAPAIPAEERDSVSSSELRQRVFRALLPPLLLIVLVLGSIFGGVASPTEAAAMGSFGAIILTLTSGKFTVQILREVMLSALTITCMVFVILVGATFFGLVFRLLGGDEIVSDIIKSIPYGQNGVLIVVMALFFVLGFVLDFIEITFIIVPIMKPIVKELAIDPLWFSILIAINLQTSFLTPPFGFSLFYLKGVVPPNVTTMHIYRGVAPFVVIQIIGLIVAFIFPETVTWLPKAIGW